MQSADSLIHARWIIPVEPDDTVLENHCVVVRAGRILDVLPSNEAKEKYEALEQIELGHHILFPGLVNTHTHASMTLLRGLADDLPLMDWLQNHIWPAEARHVSDQFVYDGTLLAAAESLRSGVTCLNEMYFFPDEAAKAALEAHIRLVTGLIVIDFPTVWAANAEEYLDKAQRVHDQFRGEELVTTAFAPHAPYTVSDEPLRRIASWAEELDIPIHMHIHETAHEIDQALEQHGSRPLARLDELGLLTPRLLAVHMTQLEEAEIERIAETGVSVVHCPESNMKLASGFCPTDKLLQAGINLALGTDGTASNNDLDLLGEGRSAAMLAKVVSGNASALPAHTVLRMATLGGAKALGLDSEIGSLVSGKAADMAAINLGELETQPVYNPISHLIYCASRQQVTDVWVAGQRVLKDRRLTRIDEQEMVAKANHWAEKIRES